MCQPLQVRSRTAHELKDGISASQARANEDKLFETHEELKLVAPEYKGIAALSNKLVQIQAERIQSHLPALQKQVVNEAEWPKPSCVVFHVVHSCS